MAYADYRKFTVAALTEIMPMREAAMDEAVSRGDDQSTDATVKLVLALLLVSGEIAIAAAALTILLRRLVAPVQAMTDAVSRISRGELDLEIAHRDRTDEIGAMASAIGVLRDQSIEAKRLAQAAEEQTQAKLDNAAQIASVTKDFERRVGYLVDTLGEAAGDLRGTAQGMHATAGETRTLTEQVASAAEIASQSVGAVAAAVEELSASSREIGARVEQSATATRQAAEEARRTDGVVRALTATTERIGEEMDGIAASIASAVEEQGSATDEISRNALDAASGTRDVTEIIGTVANGASKTGQSAGQVLTAADSLKSQAGSLDQEVRQFLSRVRDAG
jgi:methyl-accepting chemotaxis protein